MIVELVNREDFLKATQGFVLFYEPMRNFIYTIDATGTIYLYRLREPSELKKIKQQKTVYTAILVSTTKELKYKPGLE